MAMLQHDRVFGDSQFIGQETTQSGISFSFHCRRAELDLDHVATPACYLVDLCVGNRMDANGCHWLNLAAVYQRCTVRRHQTVVIAMALSLAAVCNVLIGDVI